MAAARAPEVLGVEDPERQPSRKQRDAIVAARKALDEEDRAFLVLVLVIGGTVLFAAAVLGLAVRVFLTTSGLGG
jgi:hypothetical protein